MQGWRHPNFSWSLTRMSLSSRVMVATQSLGIRLATSSRGSKARWGPESSPGDINVVTAVFPYCETSDVAAQKAILEAMTPIAKKFFAEAKAQGEDSPRMALLILTKTGLLPFPDFFYYSSSEKFKISPLVLTHPSCALIKWLLAESSRTGGVVAHSSSSELSAHQMGVRRVFGGPPFYLAGAKDQSVSSTNGRSSCRTRTSFKLHFAVAPTLLKELPQGPQGTTARTTPPFVKDRVRLPKQRHR